MATAMNCRVTVYKGVPLVKGGTEVLYASGSSASSVLSGFSVATFNNYYYTREDEGKIQVESDIAALEGANYVSFQNISHGGKLYFGFIDHLRYVNDGTTEIQFTIDPFPTFVGDCVENDYCYVIRNTVESDVRGNYTTEDFLPATTKNNWSAVSSLSWAIACNEPALFFVCNTQIGSTLKVGSVETGIQVKRGASLTDIGSILQDSGTILGCYLLPSSGNWILNDGIIESGAAFTLNVGNIGTYRHQKIYTGVYAKVVLKTNQGSKMYDLDAFADTSNIAFGYVKMNVPQPSIHIYPKNYKGLADNLAEGITMICPAIPVSTPQVYTQGQLFSDVWGIVGGAITGAMAGAAVGGVGAIPGALVGAGAGVANMGKNMMMTKFQPPSITSSSIPLVTDNFQLRASADIVTPDATVLSAVDDYFDYFGYQIEYEMRKADVNTRNGAFLKTGSVFLSGSEADDEINRRLMNGIKIKKQF